jgi:hypothetical protein
VTKGDIRNIIYDVSSLLCVMRYASRRKRRGGCRSGWAVMWGGFEWRASVRAAMAAALPPPEASGRH